MVVCLRLSIVCGSSPPITLIVMCSNLPECEIPHLKPTVNVRTTKHKVPKIHVLLPNICVQLLLNRLGNSTSHQLRSERKVRPLTSILRQKKNEKTLILPYSTRLAKSCESEHKQLKNSDKPRIQSKRLLLESAIFFHLINYRY